MVSAHSSFSGLIHSRISSDELLFLLWKFCSWGSRPQRTMRIDILQGSERWKFSTSTHSPTALTEVTTFSISYSPEICFPKRPHPQSGSLHLYKALCQLIDPSPCIPGSLDLQYSLCVQENVVFSRKDLSSSHAPSHTFLHPAFQILLKYHQNSKLVTNFNLPKNANLFSGRTLCSVQELSVFLFLQGTQVESS